MSEHSQQIVANVMWCLKRGLPAVVETNGDGRLVVVVWWQLEGPLHLIVGLEGKALCILNPLEEIDVFELVSEGFPIHIAEAVGELILALVAYENLPIQITARKGT